MPVICSGMLVLGSNIADALLVLLRNVVLARLLSVEDFGIAATFSILLMLMDWAQAAGLQRMVVQAPDAEEQRLLDSIQGAQFALSLGTALIVVATAWPFALAMGTASLTWAYALLAIVPAARAFFSLDCVRQQRQGRFGPTVAIQLIPQLAGLAAIWPAYRLFGDFRTMLVVILVQQIALTVVAQFCSSVRFAIRFDREIGMRAFHFGWPLFVNSLLLFLVINGDRMIVSNRFGLTTLGWFSLAAMLTLMPMMLLARSVQTLVSPGMARAQDDPPTLQRQNDLLADLLALLLVAFVAGAALLGEPILVLVFGEKFQPAAPFLLLLAVMQGIRLVRTGPALTAMARAETRNPLYTNIVRIAAVPVAFGVAIATGDLHWMLATGIAGEIVAGFAAGWLAQRMVGINPGHYYAGLLCALVLCGAIVLVAMEGVSGWLLVPAALPFAYIVRGFWRHALDLIRR